MAQGKSSSVALVTSPPRANPEHEKVANGRGDEKKGKEKDH